MNNLRILILAAILSVVTMGCTGTMDGVVQSDAGRIEIMYTDSRVAVAELITVLPDGERFGGKPERLDRTKDMMEAASTGTDDISAHFEALQTFPGNVKATLSGNRGNIIKCRFKLTDVILGFSSGGFGICQISDGRVIDVFF